MVARRNPAAERGVFDSMTRALVAAILVALAASPSALAKGPSEATLQGPGLESPIEFGGFWRADRPNRQPLQPFLEAFGFFPAAFGTAPHRTSSRGSRNGPSATSVRATP